MRPSSSFEYDPHTQGQGSQDTGSQRQQPAELQPQLAKQASMKSEVTPARGGVRLVDQHVPPGDERGLPQQCGGRPHLEGRTGMATTLQEPTHHHDHHHIEQQQQQQRQQLQQPQQLVSWGALGPADAAQAWAGAVGHKVSLGSEGILQALQELHKKPPWTDLKVCWFWLALQ